MTDDAFDDDTDDEIGAVFMTSGGVRCYMRVIDGVVRVEVITDLARLPFTVAVDGVPIEP